MIPEYVLLGRTPGGRLKMVPDYVLPFKKAATVMGVSMSTLRRMTAAQNGPQITRLSTRRLGIRQSHLTEWLEAGKCTGSPEMKSREAK